MRSALVAASLALIVPAATAWAGAYSRPTDTAHAIDPAIAASSPDFVEWANAILPLGAGTHLAPRGSTSVSLTGFNSLGDPDADQIAHGDSPGYLTVTFPTGIRNWTGADFAVFKNGFTYGSPNGLFMELAYVEVSTNGLAFAQFPSISTITAPVVESGAFAGFDTSNVYNLAGKHASGYGTPFNLDDLLTDPLVLSGSVNLANIQCVRLFNIPGSGAFFDSAESGGFDFRLPDGQGVGVLNAVPESATLVCFARGTAGVIAVRARQSSRRR